jgi:radical SAM superfamily enzyme YgiQ (UPF0313 family)
MRILLLSPPYLPEYMRNARCDFVSLSATQWYPILLGYCGAFLEGRGYEVKLVDAPANHLNHQQTRNIVKEYRPHLLILYTGLKSEDNDLEFGDSLLEELDCEGCIVGPFAGIHPDKILEKTQVIDKLVLGEFEYPVAEIAEGKKNTEIKNLVYKEHSHIRHNPMRPNLSGVKLDDIPFVSRFFRDQVDIRRYKTPSESYPFLDIMTGRGCVWGHCTYCLWVHTYIQGSVYNQRSLDNVVEELRFIESDMKQVRSVMIQDDTFTEMRAEAFSEAKLAAGIRLPWSCYSRGNLSFATMALMKKAGCRNLHVGYESASPRILKRVKKGVTIEQMTRFTADAKRAGLRIHGDFAIGFAGETEEEARQTIQWACQLRPDTAQFQLMIPFPGTPYFKDLEANGWLNANGQPNMPWFSNENIRLMAKKAYRRFYLSPQFAWQCCRHPYDHFFGRLKTISRAIPAILWKRWQI